MSVIVRGMDMPERCGRCFFVRWSNLHQTAWCTLAQEACFEDFSRDYKNRRADFCPLVEIPSPHGRLIDAAFEEQHYTSMTTNPTPDVTEQDKHNSLVIVRALQMAKTIIEAEE